MFFDYKKSPIFCLTETPKMNYNSPPDDIQKCINAVKLL